ncbi:MAG: HAMP domain-containing histidine kinase [Actinomycetia bacterium]|nr:HAMP domain-containing histidine kinase [Actinomycetes bacterium]
MYQSTEKLVKADADQVLSIIQIEGNVIRFDKPYEIISTSTYFVVFDARGNANLESETLPELVNLPIRGRGIRYINIGSTRRIVYDQPLSLSGNIIGWVRVSRSMEDIISTLGNLRLILFTSIPFYLIIASVGGLFLANRSLKSIDEITKTAREISKGDIKQRLQIPKTKDEIGRLAITFNEMLDRIESFIKKERQFASDASHELRTPLAIISAEAEQSLSVKQDKRKHRQTLKKILSETKKMSYIISQLLMINRTGEGEQKLDFEVLELNTLVDDIVKEYQRLANEKKIKLNYKPVKDINIKADQTLITRLLINLIDNTIKYTGEGGKIDISLTREQNFAFLAVEDNGVGIADSDIPYIFDRFYQADKARNGQGTGLGLSIVKWIAKVHRGKIKVESSLGSGTRFIVKLPVGQSPQD